jgi:hypothetical protein
LPELQTELGDREIRLAKQLEPDTGHDEDQDERKRTRPDPEEQVVGTGART